jgi:holo-[acyl-carrier protein] synthase
VVSLPRRHLSPRPPPLSGEGVKRIGFAKLFLLTSPPCVEEGTGGAVAPGKELKPDRTNMRIGTDIEQISRVAEALARTPRLTEKLFTPAERAYCEGKGRPAQHFAARFCAKEAFAKAMGVSLSWQDVEILREDDSAPELHTTGEAARLLAGRAVRLSLSHAGDYAIAMVLIED